MKISVSYKKMINEQGVPIPLLIEQIKEHQGGIERLNKLDDYYNGKHDIQKREMNRDVGKPNNQLVHNYPKYITNTVVGYQMGDEIKYSFLEKGIEKNDAELKKLTGVLKRAKFDFFDDEIAKDMSVFGKANVLVYMSDESKPEPKIALLDPRESFIVTCDTVKAEKLFSVHYFKRMEQQREVYIITVYTDKDFVVYETTDFSEVSFIEKKRETSRFLLHPMIEYKNNEENRGDFEDVISLIDALNIIQSDRVNSIESAVDAILFLKNFSIDEESARKLRDSKILASFTTEDSSRGDVDAKWLINHMNQGDVEVLRGNLVEEIHNLSLVPSFADENFAGNQSGVALSYKLIGLGQLVKRKNKYMKFAKIETLEAILSAKNNSIYLDPNELAIEFTYSLPTNELETAQIVSLLHGIIPDKYLFGRLPFIKDPELVAEEIEIERKEKEASRGEPFDDYVDSVLDLDFSKS